MLHLAAEVAEAALRLLAELQLPREAVAVAVAVARASTPSPPQAQYGVKRT